MEPRGRDGSPSALRPGDPRRFLVEVMIGAAVADGGVDPREHATVEHLLHTHPAFAGLSTAQHAMLRELATDAINFAGGALARVPALTKGLPGRLQRLTAFALACDVVVADAELAHGERSYLDHLRLALRLAGHEAFEIYTAAQHQQSQRYLDDRRLRLRSLVGLAVELFTLRALATGKWSDAHRFELRDFFLDVPDLALADHELERLLYDGFRHNRPHGLEPALAELAARLPEPVDRYWMMVYAMAAEPPIGLGQWSVFPFLAALQRAFGLGDPDMQLAATDAAGFPASLRRPT